MDISLPEGLERFVNDQVELGLYTNQDEVARDALRLLERREEVRRLKLQRLRKAIQAGDDQIARGEFSERSIAEIISCKEKQSA